MHIMGLTERGDTLKFYYRRTMSRAVIIIFVAVAVRFPHCL